MARCNAQNGVSKPQTENVWQVWQVISIVISIRYYYFHFLPSFVVVLEKAAIPAMVLCSLHKQAKNSMAGCCNNLP
jgi:hypothetical protein